MNCASARGSSGRTRPSRWSGTSALTRTSNAPVASASRSSIPLGEILEAAEHHPIVRGVRDREAQIRAAHRLEAVRATARRVPGGLQLPSKRLEAFARHRGEQRGLVGEMPVERRARDAQPLADGPQREPRRPRLHGSSAPLRPTARGAGRRGDRRRAASGGVDASLAYGRVYQAGVDTVNMFGYMYVDYDNIDVDFWMTDAPLTATGLLMLVALAASLAGLWLDPRVITGMPGVAEAGQVRDLDRHLHADPGWVFSLSPRLAAHPARRRLDDGDHAGARSGDHRRAGVARHDEPLQRRHAARRGALHDHGVGNRDPDARRGRRGGRAVASVVRRPRARLGAPARHDDHDHRRVHRRPDGRADAAQIASRARGASDADLRRPHGGRAGWRAGDRPAPAGASSTATSGSPHFLGLHALQALPLVALLLAAPASRTRVRVRLTLVAAGSYAALFAILLVQALRGQPLLDADPTDVRSRSASGRSAAPSPPGSPRAPRARRRARFGHRSGVNR